MKPGIPFMTSLKDLAVKHLSRVTQKKQDKLFPQLIPMLASQYLTKCSLPSPPAAVSKAFLFQP